MRTLAVLLFAALAVILIASTSAGECSEGETREENCNNCICTTDGVWSCTKRVCVSKREFKCNPGEVFKMACNTCRCSPDGKNAACTLKFCPRPFN